MKYKLMVLFAVGITLSLTLKAQQLASKSPKTYIVKEGDTLWELAANLLDDPMLWPQLWSNLMQSNQSTQNPNLIYPGDQLSLLWIKGEPKLTYKRKIKLSPHFTYPLQSLEKVASISMIPPSGIITLQSKDLIVDTKLLNTLPRLVNVNLTKTRFVAGDIFYAEGQFAQNKTYGIYRLGSAFEDMITGEYLGTELIFVGYSKASKETNNISIDLGYDVTAHCLFKSAKEARVGDLILPITENETLPSNIIPQFFSSEIEGYIVSIKHNAVEAAQWNTVIINKGIRDDIKLGSLFSVLQSKPNRLTDNIIGELMVIKRYEKVSVAVVLHAKQTVRMKDKIQGRLKKH